MSTRTEQRLKDVLVGAYVSHDRSGCTTVRWTMDEPTYTVGGCEIWVDCPRQYIGTAFRESERRATIQVSARDDMLRWHIGNLEAYLEYLDKHTGSVINLDGRVTMKASDETLVEDLVALRNFILALPEYHQREVQQWKRQYFLHGCSILGAIVSSFETVGMGIWFLTGARVGWEVLVSSVVCILLIVSVVYFARRATDCP